jgi:glycosyltransferase involved in cell wall biosynthesis
LAPSLEDNLPNTVMEALACGTPVVGFPTGGIPEMVDHLKNGWVTAHHNGDELAAAIQSIVGNESRLYEMRANAREKVLRSYSNAIVAKRYLDAYREALT